MTKNFHTALTSTAIYKLWAGVSGFQPCRRSQVGARVCLCVFVSRDLSLIILPSSPLLRLRKNQNFPSLVLGGFLQRNLSVPCRRVHVVWMLPCCGHGPTVLAPARAVGVVCVYQHFPEAFHCSQDHLHRPHRPNRPLCFSQRVWGLPWHPGTGTPSSWAACSCNPSLHPRMASVSQIL